MATVTITITDTPGGGVSLHTTHPPAVGQRNTPAQALALDVYRMASHDAAVLLHQAGTREPIAMGTLADLVPRAAQ